MPRTIRFRSQVNAITGTKLLTRDDVVISSSGSTVTRTSSCSDFHGRPIADGTFSSDQHRLGLYLTGSIVAKPLSSVSDGITFIKFPFGPILNSVDTAHLVEPSDWFTSTVARSNPSRPVVTPLTLIQDFKEIPGQLRDIGRLMTKKASTLGARDLANQHLALQFGWLPLIDDVHKLLDLQTYVQRRTREFQKLYSSTGLRRRLQLMDDTQVGAYKERITVRTGCYLDATHDIEVKRRVWATIHWKPTAVPPGIHQDISMNQLARKVVLGWTPEGLTKGAWDVLPWTWMINWFVNVGDFLLKESNTVPASHSNGCLMNEVVVTCSPGSVSPVEAATCNVRVGGTYKYTSKRRVLSGGVVPTFKLPFLSNFRLSILGALFVQRFHR